MFKSQTISDKKLYRTTVKIPFTKEEAKLIRRGACHWEPLEDNFRKGKRIKGEVVVSFLGWELCELVGAIEMEASVAEDCIYGNTLKEILEQKVMPVKRVWLKG